MWPFRHRGIEADSGDPTAPTADAPSPAAYDVPSPDSAPSTPTAAWRQLAPIQRITTDIRPVTQPAAFADSLVSWKSPALLEPLGHYVSADAPVGVIDVDVGRESEPATHDGAPEQPLSRPAVQRFAPNLGSQPAMAGPTPVVGSPIAAEVAFTEPTVNQQIAPDFVRPEPPRPTLPIDPPTVIQEWIADPVAVDEPALPALPLAVAAQTLQANDHVGHDELPAVAADRPPTIAPTIAQTAQLIQPLSSTAVDAGEVVASTPQAEPVTFVAPQRRLGLGLPVSRSASESTAPDSVLPVAVANVERRVGFVGMPVGQVTPVQREAIVPATVTTPTANTSSVDESTADNSADEPSPPFRESTAVRPLTGSEPISEVDGPSPGLTVQPSSTVDQGIAMPVASGAEPNSAGDPNQASPMPMPLPTQMPMPAFHVQPITNPTVSDAPASALPSSLDDGPQSPPSSPTPMSATTPSDPGGAIDISGGPSASSPTLGVDVPTVVDPELAVEPQRVESADLPVALRPEPIAARPVQLDPESSDVDEADPGLSVAGLAPTLGSTSPSNPVPAVAAQIENASVAQVASPAWPASPGSFDFRPLAGPTSVSTQLLAASVGGGAPVSVSPTLGQSAVQREAGARFSDQFSGSHVEPNSSGATGIESRSKTVQLSLGAESSGPIVPLTSAVPQLDGASGNAPWIQRSQDSPSPRSQSAGDIAVASGLGTRTADGAVVFRSLAVTPSIGNARSDSSSATVATSGEASAAFDSSGVDVADISVQLIESSGADQSPAASGGGASAAPAAAPAAGGAAAGADLDELARRLYGRIRIHLRNELRLDRERAGSLVETRR